MGSIKIYYGHIVSVAIISVHEYFIGSQLTHFNLFYIIEQIN